MPGHQARGVRAPWKFREQLEDDSMSTAPPEAKNHQTVGGRAMAAPDSPVHPGPALPATLGALGTWILCTEP
ncbi:unnamed protein product [Lampetra planeri]